MMNEIISWFLQAPLFVQVLPPIIIVLLFAALIIVVIFHRQIGIKSIGLWYIEFTTKIKEQLEESNKQLEESNKQLKQSNKELEEARNAINDLNQKIEELERKPSELPGIVEPPLPGRYFIGIDIGTAKIDFCLIDYNRFVENGYSGVKVIEGERPTPKHFSDIYGELVDIVQKLSEGAKTKDIFSIDGIGLGLPGQVDPREGQLVKAPGFKVVKNEPVVQEFARLMKQELKASLAHPQILNERFPIEIDNDVRCATRYVWKRYSFDDVICIFVGVGLGSGIVLGGKMLYGYNFTAGEIGHITISESCEFLKGQICKCGSEGCHWEMCVSSRGMINIAKNLNPKEYAQLKRNYEEIIKGEAYKSLLDKERFSEHSTRLFDKEEEELTTYFFSLAFHAGEEYASKVVKEFIKYLAIGIANYINVINPQVVYLGGGMIRGFYDDKYKSPYLEHPTAVLLRDEMNRYALPSASDVAIVKRDYRETRIASMGAALIFKDQSYFDFKNKTKRETR